MLRSTMLTVASVQVQYGSTLPNGERGKSLINTPEWSNAFGPDSEHVDDTWRNLMKCKINRAYA